MDETKRQTIDPENTRVELRPVGPGDRGILQTVYAASREIELAMTPWTDAEKNAFVVHQFEAQSAYYAEKFPDASHDMIIFDGEAVGRVWVDRDDGLISILDLTVLTGRRRQGVGTSIITMLQKEAGETGRRLGVFVENFNPSQELFRKLGFEVVTTDEMNLYLEWKGPAGSGS